MSMNPYERYVLGFCVDKKEYEKNLGIKAIEKEEPRYDTKTGGFSHYEKIQVEVDDIAYSFLGVEDSCFHQFIETLDLKIQEILKNNFKIYAFYQVNADVEEIYIGYPIKFPISLNELNERAKLLQILFQNREIKIYNYTDWM